MIAIIVLGSASVGWSREFPGKTWPAPVSKPVNWSESGLAAAKGYSDAIQSTAVMVVQHGEVIASWGDTTRRILSMTRLNSRR